MIRKHQKNLMAFATLALLAMASGCAERQADEANLAAHDGGVSPTSSEITYPEGWTEVVLDANGATTKIDSVGHYKTDKNMCQRAGDGVYSVQTWNSLATLVNKIAKTQPATTPRCVTSPNGSRFYNRGVAELVLDRGGKRQIFKYENAEICTTIADKALADQLMAVIEDTINLADRADATDCPNYRP